MEPSKSIPLLRLSAKLKRKDVDIEFIEATAPSLYRCTVCRTSKNTPLPPFKKSKINGHVKSKSHISRVAYERIKLLELKQSKLADVPMSLPISIPEPIAHIDPPQHYFSFDEESTTLDQQGCVPPPPPDVEPPLATEEYDYAYEDPVLSDSAWAMFEHEHHDYTLNPDIFSTSFSTDFFEKNLSAKGEQALVDIGHYD
ncbi:hypothetical protein RSOLAG1IB_12237 [Rhizoctonia solani AG-1 IB]|uniref:Uncharacterized protein n=1 Tax=Thanatephorus cucumeris (strain AG1-IB / isolate 7/3/14) TaxID=1108050 RepID=A0A0B7FRV4_THACB|nr:hypothetical protein RSOLAG1IB_12237 [Rhizoctonia solani AG-1 IB]